MQALVPLKSAVDVAVIPAAKKAEIRDRIASLIKRAMDAAKAAAAANKEAAATAALSAADDAVTAGKGYVVLQLQVCCLHRKLFVAKLRIPRLLASQQNFTSTHSVC